jgi:hypothetical protein
MIFTKIYRFFRKATRLEELFFVSAGFWNTAPGRKPLPRLSSSSSSVCSPLSGRRPLAFNPRGSNNSSLKSYLAPVFCGFLAVSLVLWASDPGLTGSWEEEVGLAAGGDLAGRRWQAGRSRSRSGFGYSTAQTSAPASTSPQPPYRRSRSSSSLGGRKVREHTPSIVSIR